MKRARLRPRAEQDLVNAAKYYTQKGGKQLGAKLFDAALAALKPVERMPSIGSPRLGQICEMPGLRSWSVQDFPMLWFYFESDDHLDVVRLLGERQDIAAILREPETSDPNE